MGVDLMGVCPTGVYPMGVHLTGMHLIGMYLMGVILWGSLYCAPQRYSLPVNMYEIYGNGFVVLEIFDFSTDRYGPNLPP